MKEFVDYIYFDFWEEYGDRNVSQYPLMRGGPWKVLSLVACYLYIVKALGPKLMQNRKPFDLREVIRVFNVFMGLWNLWGFSLFAYRYNFGITIWRCPPKEGSPPDPFLVWIGFIFICSRLVEFADTIFFILRKKYNQVSNLHVFHHSIVPIVFWSVYKFSPTLENGIYPYINSLVHVIMYTYYTLATFPSMVPYLWWKKYLTALQLFQFLVIIVHSLRTLFIPGCSCSNYFVFISVLMGCIFFYLFYLFYLQTYKCKGFKESKIGKTIEKTVVSSVRQCHLNNNKYIT